MLICSPFNALARLLKAHLHASVPDMWSAFIFTIADSLFVAAFVWIAYMALDPYARKYWPDLLISWNRLVAGCWRDPLVGRDVLVGTLFGCVSAFFSHFVYALPLWFRIPRLTPGHIESLPVGTMTQALGYLLAQPGNAIIFSLAVTLVLVFTRLVLRRKAPAVAVTCLVVATLIVGGENYFVTIPLALVNALLLTTVLVRFSILAYGTSVLIVNVVLNFPMTLDFSRWYAGRSLLVLSIVVTLAMYGFRCALGKQPAFGGLIAED